MDILHYLNLQIFIVRPCNRCICLRFAFHGETLPLLFFGDKYPVVRISLMELADPNGFWPGAFKSQGTVLTIPFLATPILDCSIMNTSMYKGSVW